MDLQKLKALIDSDPLNDPPATDAAVLAWLKGTTTVQTPITYQTLMVWASEESIGYKVSQELKLYDAGTSSRTNGVINDFIVLDKLLNSGGDLDLSRNDIRAIINNLAGNGLSVPNKAALLAKSDVQVTRWSTAMPDMDDTSALYWIAQARAI